jgi:hypothetical protein
MALIGENSLGYSSWVALTHQPNFSTFVAYIVANASHAPFSRSKIPRDMPVGVILWPKQIRANELVTDAISIAGYLSGEKHVTCNAQTNFPAVHTFRSRFNLEFPFGKLEPNRKQNFVNSKRRGSWVPKLDRGLSASASKFLMYPKNALTAFR